MTTRRPARRQGLRRFSFSKPVRWRPSGATETVTGVPETYLVGPDGGVILAKHTDPLTLEDAEALLAKAE